MRGTVPVPDKDFLEQPMKRWIAAIAALTSALSISAFAQAVKVTPLGGIDGEFCPQDRALIFEDPEVIAPTIRASARSTSSS